MTLVFLAGSGTTALTLDFKGLYGRLSDDYRTVVVERAGYGWSDDSGGASRDIETVLQETRLALQEAGESRAFLQQLCEVLNQGNALFSSEQHQYLYGTKEVVWQRGIGFVQAGFLLFCISECLPVNDAISIRFGRFLSRCQCFFNWYTLVQDLVVRFCQPDVRAVITI